jgi:hypothetical protein
MRLIKNSSMTAALTQRHRVGLAAFQQHARLSIGVAGSVGGAVLLASNIASIVFGGAAVALVPLAANAALIFGGAMFLRERRRVAREALSSGVPK